MTVPAIRLVSERHVAGQSNMYCIIFAESVHSKTSGIRIDRIYTI